MLRLALCLVMLAAAPLHAGAWPRGKGKAFVSALTYATEFDTYTGLYAEWGVSDRLTFGLDLGRAVSGNAKAVGFLRLHMGDDSRRTRLAWEMGLGRIDGRAVLRPGVNWGRGLRLAGRDGWVAADSVAEVFLDTGEIDVKTDLTFGLALTARQSAMIQLQAGARHGDDPFLRLVPSVVSDIGRNTRLELGITQSLLGARETGVKLAVWMAF